MALRVLQTVEAEKGDDANNNKQKREISSSRRGEIWSNPRLHPFNSRCLAVLTSPTAALRATVASVGGIIVHHHDDAALRAPKLQSSATAATASHHRCHLGQEHEPIPAPSFQSTPVTNSPGNIRKKKVSVSQNYWYEPIIRMTTTTTTCFSATKRAAVMPQNTKTRNEQQQQQQQQQQLHRHSQRFNRRMIRKKVSCYHDGGGCQLSPPFTTTRAAAAKRRRRSISIIIHQKIVKTMVVVVIMMMMIMITAPSGRLVGIPQCHAQTTTTPTTTTTRSINNNNQQCLVSPQMDYNPQKHKKVYKVGVLAIRGFENAKKEFQATFGDYLSVTAGRQFTTNNIISPSDGGTVTTTTTTIEFQLKPLDFSLLFSDVASKQVDFIYVNPSAYACIESEYGAYSLVSQVSKRVVGGNIYNLIQFGGVIFTRADNKGINSIQDIRNQRVACASISGLGSGQMQFRLLQHQGLSYINDPAQMVFTSNQGKVVNGVLQGDFDVGYVRTDQIERTKDATTGELVDASLLKIIQPMPGLELDGAPFPFTSSTPLYPEWNIAALTHVHDDVATAVQQAMLTLDEHATVGDALVECYTAKNCTTSTMNDKDAAADADACQQLCHSQVFVADRRMRCDTTVEVALAAHTARKNGKYTAFRSTMSYMELRNMQEDTGFIRKITVDASSSESEEAAPSSSSWQCIRSSNIYDAIVCPPGHFKKPPQEVANGCAAMNLTCNEGFQCVCRPCVKGFDVDVFPVYAHNDGGGVVRAAAGAAATAQPTHNVGCAKLDICGTTTQTKPILFHAVDNKKRANLKLDILLREGSTSRKFQATPVILNSTTNTGSNSTTTETTTNVYEFSITSDQVSVLLIEILANDEQIPESPLRLDVRSRDCGAEYGYQSGRIANSDGECVCAENYFETGGGKCVSLKKMLPSILVPFFVLSLAAVWFYVERKRKQADSLWEVKPSELYFDDPPEIIGRGTFGLVLLAEYRGTQVAVKRVIPPKQRESSSRNNNSSSSSKHHQQQQGNNNTSDAALRSGSSVRIVDPAALVATASGSSVRFVDQSAGVTAAATTTTTTTTTAAGHDSGGSGGSALFTNNSGSVSSDRMMRRISLESHHKQQQKERRKSIEQRWHERRKSGELRRNSKNMFDFENDSMAAAAAMVAAAEDEGALDRMESSNSNTAGAESAAPPAVAPKLTRRTSLHEPGAQRLFDFANYRERSAATSAPDLDGNEKDASSARESSVVKPRRSSFNGRESQKKLSVFEEEGSVISSGSTLKPARRESLQASWTASKFKEMTGDKNAYYDVEEAAVKSDEKKTEDSDQSSGVASGGSGGQPQRPCVVKWDGEASASSMLTNNAFHGSQSDGLSFFNHQKWQSGVLQSGALRSGALKSRQLSGTRKRKEQLRRLGTRIRKGDEYTRLKEEFRSEMRYLSKLRHPCITTVMGAVMSKRDDPMLVMEYMDHGSLYDILHNETMIMEGEVVLPILRDISQGMRFLHAANPQVIHGDLKAQNVLVDSRFRAKVADFGLSQKKQVGATGTPLWMAPELLRGDSDNTDSSDVYSFGMILYEVYSRKDPYEGEDHLQVLREVADPTINKRPPVPSSCPPMVSSLMTECLEADPEKRPTFEELDVRLKRLDVANVEPGRKMFSHQARKEEEHRMSSQLLDKVFPKHVAEALREGRKVEPEYREMVTIFFSDIVGFTQTSSNLPPLKVSDMLDRLYLKFDELSTAHEVFKVDTVGDAYVAATNLIQDQDDHVKRMVEFSRDALKAASETAIDLDDPSKGCVKIRVGFHSGPIVANVVGSRNPKYTLFGDTINIASRMESSSVVMRIQCSDRSAALLQKKHPEVRLQSRGAIGVKGKGEMETYWVMNSDDNNAPLPEKT